MENLFLSSGFCILNGVVQVVGPIWLQDQQNYCIPWNEVLIPVFLGRPRFRPGNGGGFLRPFFLNFSRYLCCARLLLIFRSSSGLTRLFPISIMLLDVPSEQWEIKKKNSDSRMMEEMMDEMSWERRANSYAGLFSHPLRISLYYVVAKGIIITPYENNIWIIPAADTSKIPCIFDLWMKGALYYC